MLKSFSRGKYKGSRILTFIMVTFAWMFFSEKSVSTTIDKIRAFVIIPSEIAEVLNGKLMISDVLLIPQDLNMVVLVIGIVVFVLLSIITYNRDGLGLIRRIPSVPRWGLYYLLILGVLFFAASTQVSFIYNKF